MSLSPSKVHVVSVWFATAATPTLRHRHLSLSVRTDAGSPLALQIAPAVVAKYYCRRHSPTTPPGMGNARIGPFRSRWHVANDPPPVIASKNHCVHPASSEVTVVEEYTPAVYSLKRRAAPGSKCHRYRVNHHGGDQHGAPVFTCGAAFQASPLDV